MADLEHDLQDLASAIDWPDGDVASRVGRRLRAGEPSAVIPMRARRGPRGQRGWRAAVGVAAAAAVAMVAIPSSRAAIASWLSVGGERIQVSPTTRPTDSTTPTSSGAVDLALGPEVALADVRSLVGFTMPVPRVSGFEHPDEVHVANQPVSGEATLLYRARTDLPPAGATGVGMLISAFRASLDSGVLAKTIGPGTHLEVVAVQGRTGYWIEGAPHEFFYRDASGNFAPETLRLAANVLVWEVNGITVRIESALPRDDVIRIGDAMQ